MAAWEKKNAKVARAGGVSLMALSLAACGSSDSDTSSTTDSTTTTTTTDTTVGGNRLRPVLMIYLEVLETIVFQAVILR